MFSRTPFSLLFRVYGWPQKKYACILGGRSETIAILLWRSGKGTRCRLLTLLLICWLSDIVVGSSWVLGDSSSLLICFCVSLSSGPDECAAPQCRSPSASLVHLHPSSGRQTWIPVCAFWFLPVHMSSSLLLVFPTLCPTCFFLTVVMLTFGNFRSSIRGRVNSLPQISSPSLIIVPNA